MANRRIFVSHSHADNSIIDRYVAALRDRGYDLWYDRTELQSGRNLSAVIQQELETRDVLLVFISPDSVNSYWVQLEIDAFRSMSARDPSRIMLPVKIGQVEIPLLLRAYKYIDAGAMPFRDAVQQIETALGAPREPRGPREPIGEEGQTGQTWGKAIPRARQRELHEQIYQWTRNGGHEGLAGPFHGHKLSGADVFWLAQQVGESDQDISDYGTVLSSLPLQGADLSEAHLEKAELRAAHLEGANLHLAVLRGANLNRSYLERADLSAANLERVDLSAAHLEGADLSAARLEGANLRWTWFDSKTFVSGAMFDDKTRLGDIQWGGVGTVNLTSLNWDKVRRLGDERDVSIRSEMENLEAVVRACRQLSAQLRAQGMTEAADRFALRAQICQRRLFLRRGRLPQYIGSWLLNAIAGYGYRPGRTLFWYIVTILGFMYGYVQVTHGVSLLGLVTPTDVRPLEWYEALVLSVSSFHGRGFFQPLQNPGDPVAILAAVEAVIGLFIEISFIATFTQRYFGAR